MRTVVATITRSGWDAYLDSALEGWREFANSVVHLRNDPPEEPMWGQEAEFRRRLIEMALEEAEDEDVVLFLDADMTVLRDPRPIFEEGGDIFYFNLYDLWSDSEYRDEKPYWRAAENWRPWAIRASALRNLHSEEINRGIHCGHIPPFDPLLYEIVYMPPSFGLLHYGYATMRDRVEHYKRYMGVSDQLSPEELAHAQTILDDEPFTVKLPWEPEWELERAT